MELQTAINTARTIAIQVADMDSNTLATFAAEFAQIAPAIGCAADYDQLRENFVAAYVERMGCSEKSGANRWAELCQIVGLRRPQSAKAARMAELRKAKKAADKANPAGKADESDDEPETPASADESASKVLKLSAMEMHIIAMIRAGKFAQVHEAIRSLESA